MSKWFRSFFTCCFSLTFVGFLPSVTRSEEPQPYQLEEVVVTSTRLPGDPVESRVLPAKITVITAEDIQNLGSKTVQEAIQYATGIVMYDQVGNSFQQTIDLRGFNGQPVPATSVFVDGVRVNEPDFNTVNFDMIPIESIERIEILPGASAIYGKDALGGVINIVTKRGKDKPQMMGETVFGSFHRERYSINSSGALGKLDYFSRFARESETNCVRMTARQALPLGLSLSGNAFYRRPSIELFTVSQPINVGGMLSVATTPTKLESRGATVQLQQEAVPAGHRNILVFGGEL